MLNETRWWRKQLEEIIFMSDTSLGETKILTAKLDVLAAQIEDAAFQKCKEIVEGTEYEYGSQGNSDERHEWANRAYNKAKNDILIAFNNLIKK